MEEQSKSVNNVSFDDSMKGKVRKYDDSSYMNGEPYTPSDSQNSHVIHRELSVSLHSMLCLILPIHSETASLASLKDTLVMKEVSTSVSRRSSTGSFREKVTNYSSFLWRTIQTIKPPMAMDVVCVVCFTL